MLTCKCLTKPNGVRLSNACDPDYYVICGPDVGSSECSPEVNMCGPDYDTSCVPDCDPNE